MTTVTMNTRGDKISHRPQTLPPLLPTGKLFEAPKSSPVRPLACNWYYCAQFIAKPKVACVLCFSWSATSSNLCLWANMMPSIKSEVNNVSLRRHRSTEPQPYVTCSEKFGKDRTCSSKIMFADRQTHTQTYTQRHTDTLITILCSPIGAE